MTPREIKEGIPLYSADRYWGKAPEEELRNAVRTIESEGWDAFNTRYRGRFDFTFEENRADWRFVIPVTREWTVLDTGAGMGRISIPLARVAKKVVAFDSSFLRMKYLKLRSQKEGLRNIEVMVADFFDAPFADHSFDLIVMNGVLEWVGKTERFRDPREAQLEALRICKRLLKPGGYLYIGIENRWAFSYLKGVDHSGLRFTSYLPRVLASGYTRLRGRGRYDTYTYSAGGYRSLLKEAEFGEPNLYLVYPGYNLPRILIPYGDLRMLRYVIQVLMPGTSWKHRLVKRLASATLLLRLYRFGFFSFSIVART